MFPGVRHRLLAILAADAASYSHWMSVDDLATLTALDIARRVFRSEAEASDGGLPTLPAIPCLVFETATGAVRAAAAIQHCLSQAHNDSTVVLANRNPPGRWHRKGGRHRLRRRREERCAPAGDCEAARVGRVTVYTGYVPGSPRRCLRAHRSAAGEEHRQARAECSSGRTAWRCRDTCSRV